MAGRCWSEGEPLSMEAWRRSVGAWRCDVSNEQILVDLGTVVGTERQSLVRVIVYLVEVEERRIHLELACSSMFDFCTRKLGFSEGEAFRRLTAARLVRRFPALLDAIGSGRIHLSSLVLLRGLLTERNVEELIAAASGKTKREVEELVARMAPKPDVKASIRKLPERRVSSSAAAPAPASTPTRVPPNQPQAIAEGRYRVQFTASEVLRDKLEFARSLMSHQVPSGDLAVIVERAVELLIEKLSKEKLGKTSRPRRRKLPAKHGYVTRAARRETFDRDGAQCSFIGENGERCPARCFLEVDHVTSRALGGSGEAENLRVLCEAHNRHAAERVFGRAYVEARIRSSRKRAFRSRDRSAPSAAASHFSERQCEGERAASAPTSPSAVESRAFEASPVAPERMQGDDARKHVRAALLTLGFRGVEADRALSVLDRRDCDEPWRRPIELLVREALGILT